MTHYLGNLGGIESLDSKKSHTETRLALEKLDKALFKLNRSLGGSVVNQTIINNYPPSAGDVLPMIVTLCYPMFITASSQLIPSGAPVAWGSPFVITQVFLQFDPNITAYAATTFTIKNDQTTPTSSASITVPLGGSSVHTTGINVTFNGAQRIWLTAPSALNNLQNLYFGFALCTKPPA